MKCVKRVGFLLAFVASCVVPLAAGGAVWNAPAPDVERLLAEDAERVAISGSGPHRVAYPFDTKLTPQNSGSWSTGVDGTQSWSIELRAAGALWTALGFDRFSVPEGATVVGVISSGSGPRACSRLGSTSVLGARWP